MATPEEQAAITAAEQRTAAAERQQSDAAQRLLRLEVGKELGLDSALAGRLVGTTREEMIADVRALQALKTEAEPKSTPASINDQIRAAAGRSPSEPTVNAEEPQATDFDGGARMSTQPAPDMNRAIREALGR